ncbi:unnamed protein product [Pieris macdunnoughi]|uniref:Uncharacterized protein n=1 Tax=Pieris macdunnoughi TaxID=345717 RepID=A0A821PKW8_9NEOP|nr:unnamed protein product [Pieris macdunnoughi]
MSAFLTAFICAIVLAVIVIIFIAYCMFCNERHKSERFQFDITDIRRTNIEIAQKHEQKTKEVSGVFVLARKKHREDYSYHKRPDYPEGPVTIIEPRTDKLIEILNDSGSESRNCVEFDDVPYHSEV